MARIANPRQRYEDRSALIATGFRYGDMMARIANPRQRYEDRSDIL